MKIYGSLITSLLPQRKAVSSLPSSICSGEISAEIGKIFGGCVVVGSFNSVVSACLDTGRTTV